MFKHSENKGLLNLTSKKILIAFVEVVMSILLVVTFLPAKALAMAGEQTVQPVISEIVANSGDSLAAKAASGELDPIEINKMGGIPVEKPLFDNLFNSQNNDESSEDEASNFDEGASNASFKVRVQADGVAPYEITDGSEAREFIDKHNNIIMDFMTDWNEGSRISIPKDKTITINLHGFLLNRGLGRSGKEKGEVLKINGNSRVTINGASTETEKRKAHTIKGFTSTNDDEKKAFTVYGGVMCGGCSDSYGGCINDHGHNSVITFNDVTMFGCKADTNFWGARGHGGAITIWDNNNTFNFNNSVISRCFSKKNGGAIMWDNEAEKNTINLKNSFISTNFSGNYGGGLYMCDDAGSDNRVNGDAVYGEPKKGSSIEYNKAYKQGGGAYFYPDGETLLLSNLNIKNNTTRGYLEWGDGGGIAAVSEGKVFDTGSIVVTNCNICDNTTGKQGGGVFVKDNVLSLANCYITGNKSDGNGGGVYVDETSDISLSGKMYVSDNYKGSREQDVFLDNLTAATEHTAAYLRPSVTNDSFIGVERNNFGTSPCYWATKSAGNYNPRVYFCTNGSHHIDYDNDERKLAFKNGFWEKDHWAQLEIKEIEHQVALEHPVKDLLYTSGNNDYQVYRGTISYPIISKSDDYMSTYYYYCDGFFADDPSVYNNHLVSLSISAELTCSRENQYLDPELPRDLDYSQKVTNEAQFLADIGCNQQDIYFNEHSLTKPEPDSIGCAIGSKQLTLKTETGEDDDSYILMPIIVRGLAYEAEWSGNFKLGESGPHQGFSEAADKVISSVTKYINSHDLTGKVKDGKVKFWIMGHSRAGATTNIAGKRLTDTYGKDGNKVFAYAFEPPLCAPNPPTDLVNESWTYNGEYKNIHNIINAADLVINIPYYDFGFTRYGVSHYQPGKEKQNSNSGDTSQINSSASNSLSTPEEDYQLPDVFDNESIAPTWNEKSSEYVKIRDVTKEHYNAINPYAYYSDMVHSAIINFAKAMFVSGEMFSESGNLRRADTYNKYITSWLFDYSFQQDWGDYSSDDKRQKYTHTKDGRAKSFEKAATELLGQIMSQNPYVFNNITTFIGSGLNIDKTLVFAIDTYSGDNEADKKSTLKKVVNMVMNALSGIPDFEEYYKEHENTMREDLQTILYFVLNFVSKDWNAEGLWGTSSFDLLYACPIIGTGIHCLGNILGVHYAEVSLAWARAYDDYYVKEENGRDDLTPVKVNWDLCKNPEDPQLRYGGQVYQGYVEGQTPTDPIDLTQTNTLQLFTDNNDGDLIYYNMKETANPAEVEDPTDTCNATHYQTNIKVNLDEDRSPVKLDNLNDQVDDTIYTIKAVSLRFNKFSKVRIFQIKAIDNGKFICVESPTYEEPIVKHLPLNSNVLLSTDEYFGTKKFVNWTVKNAEAEPEEDVTDVIFNSNPNSGCNQNINATWVKMPNYSLHFIANYEDANTEIHVNLDKFKINEPLPDKTTPWYVIDGQQITPYQEIEVKWHEGDKDGRIVTGENMDPEKLYVLEMDINLDYDSGFVLSSSLDRLDFYENDKNIRKSDISIEPYLDDDTPHIKIFHYAQKLIEINESIPSYDKQVHVYAPNLTVLYVDAKRNYIKGLIPETFEVETTMGGLTVNIEGVFEEAINKISDDEWSKNIVSILGKGLPFPDYVDNPPDAYVLELVIHMCNNNQAPKPAINWIGEPLLEYEPEYVHNYRNEGNPGMLTLNSPFNFDIRYTTDGSDPITSVTAKDYHGETIFFYPNDDGTHQYFKYYSKAGTYMEQQLEASDVVHCDFIVEKAKRFDLKIQHTDIVSKQQISDEETIAYSELDTFTFGMKNIEGYEFDHWEDRPEGSQEIITEDNKYNNQITITKLRSDASVVAFYKPIIKEIKIGVLQPTVNAPLASNVSSLSIKAVSDTSVDFTPEEIQQYVKLIWVYDLGECQGGSGRKADFNEEYMAAININKDYFADKNYYLKWRVNIDIFDFSTQANLISAYYTTDKVDTAYVDSLSVNAMLNPTPKAKLLQVGTLSDISDVPKGTDLSEVLPSKIDIVVERDIVDKANIDWDINKAEPPYHPEPEYLDDQSIRIPGKIVLPDIIDNVDEIPLDVNIRVDINGAPYSAEPTITPPAGTYEDDVIFTLSSATEGSTIWYKVDEQIINGNGQVNNKNEDFKQYTGPFKITTDDQTKLLASITCYSSKEGMRDSQEDKYEVIINKIFFPCRTIIIPEEQNITVYDDFLIPVELDPPDTVDNELIFTSDNEDVATVEENLGIVRAKKIGTCNINVETQRGHTKATMKLNVVGIDYGDVSVEEPYIWYSGDDQTPEYVIEAECDNLVGVYVDDSAVPLVEGADYTKTAVPSNGVNSFSERPELLNKTKIKFSSTYLDGLSRTGEGQGHKIEFKYIDGAAVAYQKIKFTDCESLTNDPESLDLQVYDSSSITASLTPTDTDDTKIIYWSSNPEIVSVDEVTGDITANKIGNCTIYSKTEHATEAQVYGETQVNVYGLTYTFLNEPQTSYHLYSFGTIQYIIDADSAKFKDVYVDGNKLLRGQDYELINTNMQNRDQNVAQTDIVLKTEYLENMDIREHNIYFDFIDGSASIDLTIVFIPCDEVIVDPQEIKMQVYDTAKVEVSVVPEDTDDDEIVFSSSDENVATVDPQTGEITANHIGTCEIYATTTVDKVSSTVSIEVYGLEYKFEQMPDPTYQLGSNESRAYIIHAKPALFKDVFVDDKPIDKSHYEYNKPLLTSINAINEENTVVTILPSLFESLDACNHEIVFEFEDGSSTTSIEVFDRPELISAQTSDSDYLVWLFASLFIISAGVLFLTRTRRFNFRR